MQQHEQKSMSEQGYVVARLGASASVQDMEAVARRLMHLGDGGSGTYNGMGGVSRNTIGESSFVDSSAGAPSEVKIQFHNEMAYARTYPKFVTFAMVKQADSDGSTLLADNLQVQSSMSKPLLDKFRDLGVQYIRYLHDEKESEAPDFYNSWQRAFVTEDIDTAMHKANNRDDFSILRRCDDRRLRHVVWCPVFHQHPDHGKVFFNSVLNRHGSWLDGHPYWGSIPMKERPYHCVWGDGSEFTDSEMAEIRQVHEDKTIKLHLDPGDVLVVDNLRVAHGRTPYRGYRQLGLLLSDMVPRTDSPAPQAFLELMDQI